MQTQLKLTNRAESGAIIINLGLIFFVFLKMSADKFIR